MTDNKAQLEYPAAKIAAQIKRAKRILWLSLGGIVLLGLAIAIILLF